MKTTLTLDDDVANFLREQSRLQGKSFELVVNEILRHGMASDSKDAERACGRHRVTVHSSGYAPGVDPLRTIGNT